jgi:hypothetical protein
MGAKARHGPRNIMEAHQPDHGIRSAMDQHACSQDAPQVIVGTAHIRADAIDQVQGTQPACPDHVDHDLVSRPKKAHVFSLDRLGECSISYRGTAQVKRKITLVKDMASVVKPEDEVVIGAKDIQDPGLVQK